MNQYPCYSPPLTSFFETIRAICHQVLEQGTPEQRREVEELEGVLREYYARRALASAAEGLDEGERGALLGRLGKELEFARSAEAQVEAAGAAGAGAAEQEGGVA